MKQSCKAADLFWNLGGLTTEGGGRKYPTNRQYNARSSGWSLTIPWLSDGFILASASEILGGVCRSTNAPLVGHQSHGKGTVQKVYTIRGGDDSQRVRFMTVADQWLEIGELNLAGFSILWTMRCLVARASVYQV